MLKTLLFGQDPQVLHLWKDSRTPPLTTRSGSESASILCEDLRIGVVVVSASLPESELFAFARGALQRTAPFELVLLTWGQVYPAVLASLVDQFGLHPWCVAPDIDPAAFQSLLRRVEEKVAATRNLRNMRQALVYQRGFAGESLCNQILTDRVLKAADSDSPLLIVGPSGACKTRLARLIHDLNPNRAAGRFEAVPAGFFSGDTATARLFGTSDSRSPSRPSKGLLDEAAGGTLVLRQIDTASQTVQIRLLELLTTGQFQRNGSAKPERCDARLIFTASADLLALSDQRQFRPDLLQRLTQFVIEMPALSEQREDIPSFAERHAQQVWRTYHSDTCFPGFSREAAELISEVDWPMDRAGMENFIERYLLLTGLDMDRPITAQGLEKELPAWLDAARSHPPRGEELAALRFARQLRLDYRRGEQELLYAFCSILRRTHSKQEVASLFGKSARWLEMTLNDLMSYFLDANLRTREELKRDHIWNRRHDQQLRTAATGTKADSEDEE